MRMREVQKDSLQLDMTHTTDISQISVQNKYDKTPILGKAREVHLYLPPVLLSSLGMKREHCPDTNRGVHKNTNQEFPDQAVTIWWIKSLRKVKLCFELYLQ